MATDAWTIDVYETPGGERPTWSFIAALEGRNRVEAIALVKLLEERGNTLRRPHSGALGDGLFELRGKELRLFYTFLPGRRVVLLDGEIKKQNKIPKRVLSRVRGYLQDARAACGNGAEEAAVKKTGFMNWIDGELQADPQLARDVDVLVNEMTLEQEIVALREMRGLSQRELATLLGTSQPYVAKLESGRIKNLGVKTLVKCARALDASLTIRLEANPRPVRRRSRAKKARQA